MRDGYRGIFVDTGTVQDFCNVLDVVEKRATSGGGCDDSALNVSCAVSDTISIVRPALTTR